VSNRQFYIQVWQLHIPSFFRWFWEPMHFSSALVVFGYFAFNGHLWGNKKQFLHNILFKSDMRWNILHEFQLRKLRARELKPKAMHRFWSWLKSVNNQWSKDWDSSYAISGTFSLLPSYLSIIYLSIYLYSGLFYHLST
jgi:hypothetical protein